MCEEVAAGYKQIGVSILGPSGFKKMFLPHLLVNIVGIIRDRKVARSASDRQSFN